MIVYEGTKSDFMQAVANNAIADEIMYNMVKKFGWHVGPSEYKSWTSSLMHMYFVVATPRIHDDAGVAIEYKIPQTSKRIDFMISGYDTTGAPNIVIVELKQWEKLEAVPGEDALVQTYLGGAQRKVVHPSYQAWSYATLLNDYNEFVENCGVILSPCAFLHNYVRNGKHDPLSARQYDTYVETAPVFTKGQVKALSKYIATRVRRGDNKEILSSLENGRMRPSKSLQDSVVRLLEGKPEFVLIDDQKVAFQNILSAVRASQKDKKKRTIIVRGGPGTGKSVIAVNLLAQMTADGRNVQYTSKNAAPRDVYSKLLKGSDVRPSIPNLFKGSGGYVDLMPNVFDVLLADEAHRLSLRSGFYGNQGENQIREIIHSSLCSVFFIDEHQRVTLNDIGSTAEIERCADIEHSEVHYEDLVSQFRCNGSDGYLAWLDNTLQIEETENKTLEGTDFDFRVFDTPHELKDAIRKRNSDKTPARLVAGYCWDWRSRADPSILDIEIGSDFAMSWNLSNPPAPYALDPGSIDQVGCIHTVQGLEFAYVGVIIGPDIRFRDGRVITDYNKRAKTDRSLWGIKKLAKSDPEQAQRRGDELIRNTYRTLLTRGMKGCYVYCTDAELAKHLKGAIGRNG